MEIDLQDGQLVEVVKTTRALELQELQDLVNTADAERKAAEEAKATHDAHAEELATNVSSAQGKLDQAKSTLTRCQELVGQPATTDVDNGSEGASEPVADGAQETPQF